MNFNFLTKKQYDIALTPQGWLEEKSDRFVLSVRHIKFAWIIGIGYWKDEYKQPFEGYTHNVLLPFMRIQFGYLTVTKDEIKTDV